MVFIMIGTSFSFVFFGFSSASETVRYNGIAFKLIPRDGIWIAKINGHNAAFSFLPEEVKDILAPPDMSSLLQNRLEIDVTYDPQGNFTESIALAQHQMSLTLEKYNVYVRKGFTSNNTYGMPIITCNESSFNVPVIYFLGSNSTMIRHEGNCIIAQASSNKDFIRAKDRILYAVLEILK